MRAADSRNDAGLRQGDTPGLIVTPSHWLLADVAVGIADDARLADVVVAGVMHMPVNP